MKIRDIVTEAPATYQQGVELGKRIMSPSQWLPKDAAANLKKGTDLGKKILSPSAWLGKDNSTDDSKPLADHVIRQTLTNAASGNTLSLEDVKVLKRIYSGVKSGTIRTSNDQQTLLTTLQAAYNLETLDDAQKQTLTQFAQQI
jgi:hypothetical protein